MAQWFVGQNLGQQEKDIVSSVVATNNVDIEVKIDLSKFTQTQQIMNSLKQIENQILRLWRPV